MASNSNSATSRITNPNPIKRRSRSSKRTPTTHLAANAADFRALVQQFTGYHSTKTASTSCMIGYRKGPVTLNFKLGSVSFQNSHESGPEILSGYDQIQSEIQLDKRFGGDVLSEDLNVQTRSSEVELDEFGSLIMGDAFDLMDDFDFDFDAISDQSFDQDLFRDVQNQYQCIYQTN